MINVVLWVVGVVLLALGILRVRGPLARMQELDRLADNAKRYDAWRGGSRTAAGRDETTGADVMRQMLRRQVALFGAVAAIGIVLICLGFAVH